MTIVVFDRSSEDFQHPNGEMRFLTFDGHSSDGDDTQDGTNSWEDIDLQEESIWTRTAKKLNVKCYYDERKYS